MKIHPYAKKLPPMSADEYQALKKDIEKNGLRQSIKTKNGEIIDGINRLKACEELGMKPKFEEYDGDDIVAYIASLNLYRRHLSAGQWAAFAVDFLLPQYEKESNGVANLQQPSGVANLQQGRAVERAAKEVHASPRSISTAKKLSEESPKDFKKVREGKISLHEASKTFFKESAKKKTALRFGSAFQVTIENVNSQGQIRRGKGSVAFKQADESQEPIDPFELIDEIGTMIEGKGLEIIP